MESVLVSSEPSACPATVRPIAWNGCGVSMSTSHSLKEIMSETLASELELQESGSDAQKCVDTSNTLLSDSNSWVTCDNIDTSSDLMLAQLLQAQFDAEHDQQLERVEEKFNGTNKVKVTYDNYRCSSEFNDLDDSDEEDLPEPKMEKDTTPQFNKSGISGKGKNIVTKHDPGICGRKNAMKIMESFPPEFETGDGGSIDMCLSNQVYNQLKLHSMVENKRSQRLHEKKEHSTVEQAVDPKTRILLYKLVNSGLLESVSGIVSTGKESVVFHANGGSQQNEVIPAECAIKVFKTTLAEFHNRAQYVKGDVRFFKDEFKKQNPRKIMKIWAEKEMINLKRMAKFGIPCPSVVTLKKHVLVMSFIGENQTAAPKLKDARLSLVDLQIAYEQCLQYMKAMYKECQLIHADMSEYNLLWWQDQLYIIDVAQAVDLMHPHAMQFLLRDCRNVSEFFKRQGVPDVADEYEMFNLVTERNLSGSGPDFLLQVEQFEKDEKYLQLGLSKTDYPFEYFFNKASSENASAALPGEPVDDDDDDGDDDDDEDEDQLDD